VSRIRIVTLIIIYAKRDRHEVPGSAAFASRRRGAEAA